MVEIHWIDGRGEAAYIATRLNDGTAQAFVYWPRLIPVESTHFFPTIEDARAWLQLRLRELREQTSHECDTRCHRHPEEPGL